MQKGSMSTAHGQAVASALATISRESADANSRNDCRAAVLLCCHAAAVLQCCHAAMLLPCEQLTTGNENRKVWPGMINCDETCVKSCED